MQLATHASSCPICGSHLSGGHALINSLQARCPACQASAPARLPEAEWLAALRRRLSPRPPAHRLPKMKIWG